LHCGFIAGWFEKSFEMDVVCIEKECRAAGHKKCIFLIGLASKVSRSISPEIQEHFSLILEPLINGHQKVEVLKEYRSHRHTSHPNQNDSSEIDSYIKRRKSSKIREKKHFTNFK